MVKHKLGFVHRDIKAENVLLLSEDRLKLADFGFSTKLIEGAQQKLDTFCGSPPYAAPELFSDDHYIGAPVDIWALGILLYFMVVGNMPFRAPTIPALKLAIIKGDYLIPAQLSLPCQRLIQRTLLHIPAHRPSIDEMLNSQFVAYPKLSAELMQEEINVYEHKQTNKSMRFCWKNKIKSTRKNYSLRERYEEITSKQKQNMPMSTKQDGTVLHDISFLHPININSNKMSKNTNKQKLFNSPKRSKLFCGSLNKKVSPMVIDKESLNYKQENIWHIDVTTEYPFFKNYDAETGDFIMMPTNTDDLSKLTSLEFEARQILEDLGINSEMLCSAIIKGPRSDIIGTYRIIINRLQKKSWLARKHVEMALQRIPPQKNVTKVESSCWIL